MLLTAKVLLTLATLGYAAIPALVDSNQTHATNPGWDPHARLHVVWQVSSYVYLGVLALYLIWTAGSDTWPLWLAAFMAAAGYGGFWTAVTLRPSAAIMGHPAAGVAWLVNTLAALDRGLKKGQIVLAGSFTRPVDIAAGDVIHADYGPLGAIGVSFV